MRAKLAVYLLAILLLACTSNDAPRISDQSYFPLRVGNFRIYQVKETDILRLACGDDGETVSNYQLKELTTDSVKNPTGYSYTIHRYVRPDDTQPWQDLNTWTARLSNNQVVVNEGNVPYLKFTFPLVEKTVWNINSYNNTAAEYDTLRNLRKPYTLTTGEEFQNTFSARSDNGEFIIYHDKHIEVYAPSIGLIYFENTQLHYFDNSNSPCFGQQVVKNGNLYIQSLISYGHQ